MPTSSTLPDGNGNPGTCKDKYLYHHKSPLRLVSKNPDGTKIDPNNIERYDCIGKSYKVKVNLKRHVWVSR